MKDYTSRLLALVVAAGSTSVLAEPYLEAGATELLLETVSVVGAEPPLSRRLDSQPLASSTVDFAQLQTLKYQQPAELLQRISGVSMVRNLRIPISGKSYTVPLVDGVALGSPYSGSVSDIRDINMRNIERIEVVKGLGSALYSSNAFGGTINAITRRPPEQHEQHLDLELGNYQRSRIAFQAAGQLGAGGYFFDASRQRMEGYRDGYQDDADQVSGKAIFQLSGANSLTLGAELIDRYERFPGALTEQEYRQDPSQAGGALGSDENTRSRLVSLQDTHQFNDRDQLQFSAVYRREDADGINYHTGPTDAVRDDADSKLVYRHQFAALQGQFMAGAGYTYGRSEFSRYRADREGNVDKAKPLSDSLSHTKISSAFAEYAFSPWQPLELSLGVRREEVSLDSYSRLNDEEVDANFASTDPRLGLTLQLSDQHSLWANYSEGFYAPNTRELYTDRNANPLLQEEKMKNRELGLRGSLAESVHYSLAYYQADIEDFIVVESFFDEQRRPYRRFSNAGLVEVSGVELDLDYRISEWWSVAMAYTYNDNIYSDYHNPYSGADLGGSSLSRSPEDHLNMRLALTPIEGLRLELEWDGISDYYTSDDNQSDPNGTFKRDDIVHLRVSYDLDNISLWLHGLNLTGTQEDDVTYSRGQRYYEVTNDTEVYAGVSYHF